MYINSLLGAVDVSAASGSASETTSGGLG